MDLLTGNNKFGEYLTIRLLFEEKIVCKLSNKGQYNAPAC